MTKTEQLARETLTQLNDGVDPLLVGSGLVIGEDLDLSQILDLIIDFLGKLFTLFNENCDKKSFSSRVRSGGPFQEMRARLLWNRMVRSEGIDTGFSSREVVRAARSVAQSKDDAWLDEAAGEITKPDWGF